MPVRFNFRRILFVVACLAYQGVGRSDPPPFPSSQPIYDPQIATDRAGVWLATWGRSCDSRYSRSIDDGVTWSEPRSFPDQTPCSIGGPLSVDVDRHGHWIITAAGVWRGLYTVRHVILRSDDG